MNQLLGSAATWPAEQLLNQLLQHDAYLRQRVAAFSGRSIQVVTRLPAFAVTALFENDRIRLSAQDSEVLALTPDASIRGSVADLLGLLLTDPESRPLANPAIEISGDASLVNELYSLLLSLDLQWGDLLAPLLGDVVTQGSGQLARQAGRWSRTTRANLARNVEDYIKEETRWLPRREGVDSFNSELDRLKLRIDRVKAKADSLYRRLDGLSD